MKDDLLKKLESELLDLNDKVFKLDEFINSKKYFELHQDMQYLLNDQYHSMRQYKQALERRIAFINEWVKPVAYEGNVCSQPSPRLY